MSRSTFLKVLLASAVSAAGRTFAELDTPRPVPEPAVKAALVFGLTKLVIWPEKELPATDTPLRLGVLGKHPFGDRLDRLAEKRTPKVRPITVVYAQDASALRDCQVVFVSRDRRESLDTVLGVFRARPVLIVGDEKGFADTGVGGMVNLRTRDDRKALEVNQAAAEAAGLRLRAQLSQSQLIEYVGRPKN
jgi:hypothetical protein